MSCASATRACDVAASVVDNVNVCREHYHVHLAVDALPLSQPGQFLQIRCRRDDDDSDRGIERCWPSGAYPALTRDEWLGDMAYLRRPFSIGDRWGDSDGRTRLLILHRAIGPGTRWLERLRPGDRVDISGPFGRAFTIPEPDRTCVLIGGGVGIPPLLYLARVLRERGHTRILAIFGARSQDLLPVPRTAPPPVEAAPADCLAFPFGAGIDALVTADDGSAGLRGTVTDGLRAWADRHPAEAAGARVAACGPQPMLAAVARATRALGMSCELCIERFMACGMGTCLSCVTRVVDNTRACGWRYALTCSEGPVFPRDLLVDEGGAAVPG